MKEDEDRLCDSLTSISSARQKTDYMYICMCVCMYVYTHLHRHIHIIKGMSPRPRQLWGKKKVVTNVSNIWSYKSSVVLWTCQSNNSLLAFLTRIWSEALETSCISVCKWKSCIKLLCCLFKWCYDYYFSEVLIREVIFLWFIVQAGSTRKNIKVSKDVFKPGVTLMKSEIISCIQVSLLC